MHAELQEHPCPPLLFLPGPVDVSKQRPDRVGAGEISGDPLVLLGPVVDSAFEQGEEEVGLAFELAVHHALREPRLLGDRVDRRPAVALLEEDRERGLEQELPVAFDLFGSTQTVRTWISNTSGIRMSTVCECDPRQSDAPVSRRWRRRQVARASATTVKIASRTTAAQPCGMPSRTRSPASGPSPA